MFKYLEAVLRSGDCVFYLVKLDKNYLQQVCKYTSLQPSHIFLESDPFQPTSLQSSHIFLESDLF
jgi:hypothetical protein